MPAFSQLPEKGLPAARGRGRGLKLRESFGRSWRICSSFPKRTFQTGVELRSATGPDFGIERDFTIAFEAQPGQSLEGLRDHELPGISNRDLRKKRNLMP